MINKKLDIQMWGEESVSSSWNYDPNLFKNLKNRKNLVEFINRTEGGNKFVTRAIQNAQSIQNKHKIKILNHFPSGVGGLTFSATDENDNRCVLKLYLNKRQFLSAKESSIVLNECSLGPKILAEGENYLIFEAVVPGTPLRSTTVDLNIMKKLITDIDIMASYNYQKPTNKFKWRTDLKRSLDKISEDFVEARELLEFLDSIEDSKVVFSHGDAQLGNILEGHNGYNWIDPEAEFAPKESDLARLYTHTCADLIGNNPNYNSDELFNLFTKTISLDIKTFLILGCIKSFKSYVSLGYGSTKRKWESGANYRIYLDLLSKLNS